MTLKDDLIGKAERREALFGIIGLGYVGLPLAVELAKAGFRVLGYDISQRVVDGINAGRSHIKDISDAELAAVVSKGLLSATSDASQLAGPDAISICVPTPLSKFKDPDMSFIQAATEVVARTLRSGQVIILESTTYPGTTREVVLPALEKTGLKVGEEFFLSFSPERVDPGNTVYHTRNTPKVVGGITDACRDVTMALYSPAIDTLVPVKTTEAAELVKLLENTFRSVNIGLANEMAIVCDKLGVDVWDVIEAAATKPFGYMKFLPGPGLGGHCIPIDPHYLAWKMRGLNYKTRFIDVAGEVNTEMPVFWVRKVADALNRRGRAVNGARVLVLGVAYKRDIDDIRESPALDIIHLLEQRGAVVSFHDPHIASYRDEEGHVRHGVPLDAAALAEAECVIIITDHAAIDWSLVKSAAALVVDTRNVLSKVH